ncbi:MAG: DUF6569 family protein [Acidobacteriaceae bacterium]|jgi:hypothetical protein
MKKVRAIRFGAGVLAVMAVVLATGRWQPVAAGGADGSGYRVLKPIESGDLTLFPVVRDDGKSLPGDQFLTLDEGLKNGEVEVTEAGKVRGLVRSRGGAVSQVYQGDQVNTLVLVNNSKRPLLLLAGEIVTGGKQDRIIAKDRIVPAGADPIDLSVFCIEHGRWTESSDKFGTSAKAANQSIMVQPAVRQQAMVAKDQQQVWDSVSGAIGAMAKAAAPPPSANTAASSDHGVYGGTGSTNLTGAYIEGAPARSLGTTSYAKAVQSQAVAAKVDEEAASVVKSREEALKTLRQEHAVGVVVAVRGEVIWADIFSDPGLLARYWTKLVRSYAAEELEGGSAHGTASVADAQRFLDTPTHGAEDSQGEVGVYRCREVKSGGTDLFTLESLLPGTGYDVHVSRVKLRGQEVNSQMARPVY